MGEAPKLIFYPEEDSDFDYVNENSKKDCELIKMMIKNIRVKYDVDFELLLLKI